jgi:hypothetical protein
VLCRDIVMRVIPERRIQPIGRTATSRAGGVFPER